MTDKNPTRDYGLPVDMAPDDVKALFSMPDDDDSMHAQPAPDHSADTLRALAERVEAGRPSKALDREVAKAAGWFRVEPRHGIGGKNGGWIAPEDFMGADAEGRPRLDSLHGTTIHRDVPDFSSSLDAVAALQEAVLPGWWVCSTNEPPHQGKRHVCHTGADDHSTIYSGRAPTEPAARLAACLRALAMEAERATTPETTP